MTDDDVMDYDQAAAFMGVNRRTLERMVHDREIPSILVRGRRTFSRELLSEWKRKRAEESMSRARNLRGALG